MVLGVVGMQRDREAVLSRSRTAPRCWSRCGCPKAPASTRPSAQAAGARAPLWPAIPTSPRFVSYVGNGSPRYFLSLDQQLFRPNFAQFVILTKDVAAASGCSADLRYHLGEQFPGIRRRVFRTPLGPPVAYPIQFRVLGRGPARAQAYRRPPRRGGPRQSPHPRRPHRLGPAVAGGAYRRRPGQGARDRAVQRAGCAGDRRRDRRRHHRHAARGRRADRRGDSRARDGAGAPVQPAEPADPDRARPQRAALAGGDHPRSDGGADHLAPQPHAQPDGARRPRRRHPGAGRQHASWPAAWPSCRRSCRPATASRWAGRPRRTRRLRRRLPRGCR